MKKIPNWVWVVLVFTFLSLIFSPFVGVVLLILILIYLNNHGFFKQSVDIKPRKPGPIPNRMKPNIPRPNFRKAEQDPPSFIHKIDFLSNREIAFMNFTSVRYLEENGSHKMIDVPNPRNAKIYIRLNHEQFDVFVNTDGRTAQLSFEKENLQILDITNHGISMIEGNKDDSYLKINYDNQFFTTLEVEALLDFFKDFSIHNQTTKFQEQPIYEDAEPVHVSKEENKRHGKIILSFVVVFALVIAGVTGVVFSRNRGGEILHTSVYEGRRNVKYLNGLSYEVNCELKEEDWLHDQCEYYFSTKSVPQIIVSNSITDTDYTDIYTYEANTFKDLEYELSFYEYKYDGQKKQYDFVNLENGKWYHLSGVLNKKDYYDNDTGKDLFVDIYVMPTSKSLIEVDLIRTIDDINDYDVTEFIGHFDFSELMSYYY